MTDTLELSDSLTICIADFNLLCDVYRLRHDVYATELNQYPTRVDDSLRDNDQVQSEFIGATFRGKLIGFIGVTSPMSPQFSLDKHVPRDQWTKDLPGPCFEIRTLTVAKSFRHFRLAGTLMYAAYRFVEAGGGNSVISMGRREVIKLYLRFGFRRAGLSSQCGDVTYELMSANISEIAASLPCYQTQLARMQRRVDWQLPFGFAAQ